MKNDLLIKAQSRPGAGFDFISGGLNLGKEIPQQKQGITQYYPYEGREEQGSAHGELGNKADDDENDGNEQCNRFWSGCFQGFS